MSKEYYLGIDCGSVSVKIAIIDENLDVVFKDYQRSNGNPILALKQILKNALNEKSLANIGDFMGVYTTGSGRFLIGNPIGATPFNEISTHAKAANFYYPAAKTIVEIGGQDSKLIFLDENGIADSQMNDICAAGTGSFIDQQAYRMGVTTPDLSELALDSANPSKISGRCSVFAKTDMIHLQQDGVSKKDIAYGLCLAVARTYIENLVKGRKIETPILFQGGVANNKGVLKAFRQLLDLSPSEVILVPKYHEVMGAIGAVLCGMEEKKCKRIAIKEILSALESIGDKSEKHHMPALNKNRVKSIKYAISPFDEGGVYMGIDVGSVSVKIVAIDEAGKLIFKYYTPNKSEPLKALKICFNEFDKKIKNKVIMGVGVTGSGREYIARCIGADIVKNEITAQAAGTKYLVPDADVIIEIGGQDSKYIKLKNGCVVDFVMNKTCAAGTGSFLSEQADRLSIPLYDFSDYAFRSLEPINVGSRCTVFMETDCIHYQQNGTPKEDIIAGLSYSVAKNYLEKVALNKEFEGNIAIQGGIAYNKSVVAALGELLQKNITIVPHHEVSGALGIAAIVKEEIKASSKFIGTDFESRIKEKAQIVCKDCANNCNLQITKFTDGEKTISGSICDKFSQSVSDITNKCLDPFVERKELLHSFKNDNKFHKGKIGIPQFLLFHELYPFWLTYFNKIGYEVVVSDAPSKSIYQKSLNKIPVDTCYPIRCSYGIVDNLLEKGIDYIYMPYITNMIDENYSTKYAHNCQYVQQLPDMIKTTIPAAPILSHTVKMKDSTFFKKSMIELGEILGIKKSESINAFFAAVNVMNEFRDKIKNIGNKTLESYKKYNKIFVFIGHSYVIHDTFFNLDIVKRLMKMGIPVIAADMLPLEKEIENASKMDLHWASNNRAVNAVDFISNYNKKSNNLLLPVFITQFGCAADSMLTPYIKNMLGNNIWLEIEVDEHNSITGILTRCEAFWDSIPDDHIFKETFTNIDSLVVNNTKLKDIKKRKKSLYIYPICEAVSVLPIVLNKHGVQAHLMKETNDYSNALGKKYANEKHCRTYQVMLGDYLALAEQNDFDKANSSIIMFDYDEACRLSLFKSLHSKMLKDHSADSIDIFSILIDDPVDWLSTFGIEISLEIWKAMLCSDYLHRYLFMIRPFEKNIGEANRAYAKAKSYFHNSINNGNIIQGFKESMDILKTVDRVKKDVVSIGVTGDGFTRVHKYSMDAIFDEIERLGGQIILPPSWNDFIDFGSMVRSQKLKQAGEIGKSVLNLLSSNGLTLFRKQIETIAIRYSKYFKEPSHKEIISYSQKYVNCEITPVIPSMFISKAVDWVENYEIDGLINAYGFNCCLGKITTPCLNKFRTENRNVPMFTFIDDGLEKTNNITRIEAFMEQIWQKNKMKEAGI